MGDELRGLSPEVDVIVPVYGVRPYLRTCVDSILKQTHPAVNIILVDDGAVDGSAELCDDIAREHARVAVVHRENGGLSAARNTGLSMASAPYVMFVDADDWVEPAAVAGLVAVAEDEAADVVIGGFHLDHVDVDGRLISSVVHVPPAIVVRNGCISAEAVSFELLGMVGYAWNKLYRREALGQRRFLEGVSVVEDVVFNAPLLALCATVVFTPVPVLHYMQRSRETLGTGFQAELGSLTVLASEAVDELLRSWCVPDEQARMLLAGLAHRRVQWALRGVVLNGTLAFSERRRRLIAHLEDPLVVASVRTALVLGIPRRALRPLHHTQAVGWALPTYCFHVLGRHIR